MSEEDFLKFLKENTDAYCREKEIKIDNLENNLFRLQRYAKENYLYDPINFYFFYNSNVEENLKIRIDGVDHKNITCINKVLEETDPSVIFNKIIKYFHNELFDYKINNIEGFLNYIVKTYKKKKLELKNETKLNYFCGIFDINPKTVIDKLENLNEIKELNVTEESKNISKIFEEKKENNIIECYVIAKIKDEIKVMKLNHTRLFYCLEAHELDRYYFNKYKDDLKIEDTNDLTKKLEKFLYKNELFIPLEFKYILGSLSEKKNE